LLTAKSWTTLPPAACRRVRRRPPPMARRGSCATRRSGEQPELCQNGSRVDWCRSPHAHPSDAIGGTGMAPLACLLQTRATESRAPRALYPPYYAPQGRGSSRTGFAASSRPPRPGGGRQCGAARQRRAVQMEKLGLPASRCRRRWRASSWPIGDRW
jgi:hypothetical protein